LGIDDFDAKEKVSALQVWAQRIVTFHLVCLTWVFFRAASIGEALHFLSGLKTLAWRSEFLTAFSLLAFFTIPLFLIDLFLEHRREEYPLAVALEPYRVAVAFGFLAAVTLLSANQINAFIYFQF
jgi:alginate O-acetyltransferase complex protein AlgI